MLFSPFNEALSAPCRVCKPLGCRLQRGRIWGQDFGEQGMNGAQEQHGRILPGGNWGHTLGSRGGFAPAAWGQRFSQLSHHSPRLCPTTNRLAHPPPPSSLRAQPPPCRGPQLRLARTPEPSPCPGGSRREPGGCTGSGRCLPRLPPAASRGAHALHAWRAGEKKQKIK